MTTIERASQVDTASYGGVRAPSVPQPVEVAGGAAAAEADAGQPYWPLFGVHVPLPGSLRALGHRNFRLFWTGQLISLIGTWMQNVARGWLVLELTGSAFWLPRWPGARSARTRAGCAGCGPHRGG